MPTCCGCGCTTTILAWRAPWLAVVLSQSAFLWTMPFIALLEGCNRIDAVSRYRLREAVVTSLALWTACLLHANLWAAVAVNGTYLANNIIFLAVQHRRFFRSMAQPLSGARVIWCSPLVSSRIRHGRIEQPSITRDVTPNHPKHGRMNSRGNVAWSDDVPVAGRG